MTQALRRKKMYATIVAANQFAACDEGMLPELPFPNKQRASGSVMKGRSRPAVFLIVRQITPSVRATLSARRIKKAAPRARNLQITSDPSAITAGIKNALPL